MNLQPGPELDMKLCVLLGINIHYAYGYPFSSNWRGMGYTVDAMQTRGWEYQLDTEGGKFHARFFKQNGDYGEHNGASSAPLATALAAIRALEGQADET